MKLKNCCFAYSIKIGSSQVNYIDSLKYDIELYDNNRVKVIERATGEIKWSTLSNVACYEEFLEPILLEVEDVKEGRDQQEDNFECVEVEIPKRRRGHPKRNSAPIEADL